MLWTMPVALLVLSPAVALGREPAKQVTPLPDELRRTFQLDPFYVKCVLANGIPVVGSAKVRDNALLEAGALLEHLLAQRDDLSKALVADKIRFGVLAITEMTTDLPEYRNLRPKLYWDKRARGLGASPQQPLVSCGEENLLQLAGDPYEGENILIHEFAHALHGVALKAVDPAFDGNLADAYREAMAIGLWQHTYAAVNREEYWAEGVQSWFDCNRRLDPQHNGIRTREQLQHYDPRLAKLLADVFRDNTWRYAPPTARTETTDKAAKFAWPQSVVAWNQANLGNGTIRNKAGNSEIVITTTARVAGAIHSLRWNDKEFVDSADHGRQIQSASNFDAGMPIVAETFNPTEAGSRADGDGDKSTSYVHRFEARGNQLTSISRMAFWLQPGEKSDGHRARNKTALSDHWLGRRVRIGYKSWPHAIDYEAVFTVPESERHTEAVFEALTGYMPSEFSEFFTLDLASGTLKPLDSGPGEQSAPVVFSTASGSHAMGVLAPLSAPMGCIGPSYGRFRFDGEKVNKWNCVFRLTDRVKGIEGGKFAFRMFLAVGTREDVRSTLVGLANEFRLKK